jgi:hypothetical protein
MIMEQPLSAADIQSLRSRGLLGESETALQSGDLIIAENVVTRERRVLDTHGVIFESNRRVLKG